ncbi:MAG: ATP-binding protein, partial [Actinomycetota bacterium]|nr:ATP-binding protein [Actinomycetota bacterium]
MRLTVRARLTLLYGALFLVAGAMLLSLNYALVRNSLPEPPPEGVRRRVFVVANGREPGTVVGPAPVPAMPMPAPTPATGTAVTEDGEPVEEVLATLPLKLRDEALEQLLTQSLLALGVMSVLAVGLGWLMAGRVLQPLHAITGTARRLSEETLHERINLEGPDDELKELADTFDGMLARLDAAFASQRRFVADASHELRTPLSIIRTEVDVALAEPSPSVAQLRAMGETVRAATERTERLLDSLLVLARSDRGVEVRDAVDLASAAAGALSGLDVVRRNLEPAVVQGDPVLLSRLVGNLVENAVRHGGGWVEVSTGVEGAWAVLRVSNDGPDVPPDVVPTLFEPFHRHGAAERTGSGRGVGLGLAIVRSVAGAHGGTVEAVPREGGGLTVT